MYAAASVGILTPWALRRARADVAASAAEHTRTVVADRRPTLRSSVPSQAGAPADSSQTPALAPGPHLGPPGGSSAVPILLTRERLQHARRIGDVLTDRGLVQSDIVEQAVAIAAATGGRVGEVLVSMGAIDSTSLARALADQWDLPFVSPSAEATDPTVLANLDLEQVLRGRWLPLGVAPDGRIRVAVTDYPSPALVTAIEDEVGRPAQLCVADPWDLQRAVLERFKEQLVDRAALGLWGRSPDQSARVVLVGWQKVALSAVLLAVAAGVVTRPQALLATLLSLAGVSFFISVAFKFWASLRGAAEVERFDDHGLDGLSDSDLPRYTVLVPVYKEANIVAQLIENLGRLDYPTHLLEVLILVEEDDVETLAAARGADPPPHFQFITVPAGSPKTKPKACNVGLEFATGEYLVIFDAEDRPDPDQLKKAFLAFRQAGEDLVCVQAALNYFNTTENVLTRMFTLEYSFWFDYMLPGLECAKLPIPLGGTSNHFRVSGLRRLGGWDPFNVTEDADLGIRASAEGMRVGVIGSTTYEEANTAIPNFIRQRSRWIKGYMQTTLVHLRHPFRLIRIAGLRQTLSFLFLVAGTPATFLSVPVLYALGLASLVLGPGALSALFPGWVLWLSMFNLGIGSTLMIYVSMMGALKRGRHDLVLWGLANPGYWLLHSVAAYKGLWQLITKPHYWEKTVHGLTSMSAADAPLGAEHA